MDPQIENYLPAYRKYLDKLVVFNDEEWGFFKEHLRLKTVKKKEYFTRSGDVCKEVGFIVSGSMRFFFRKRRRGNN